MLMMGVVHSTLAIVLVAQVPPTDGQTPPQVPQADGQAPPQGEGQASQRAARYRVKYRPTANDPWQLYSETRSLDKANTIAAEVRESGYQAEVVDEAEPAPQLYPDAADTSASYYYPTSNYASDYNYYNLPGGNYGYGWYGGWNPWYRHRVYAGYAWNNGRYWHNGWWRGHGWRQGWNRDYHWGDSWNHSHRNWNHAHAGRGSHFAHHERHSSHAHHGYAAHRATAGHHSAGHHASAWHGNHHTASHRGTGHFANGARRGFGHRAGGHGIRRGGRGSAGRHAGGMHARHLDP